MRPVSRLIIAVFLALTLTARAQEPAKISEGGSFEWRGKRIEVSGAEIARQLDLVRRLNPGADAATLLENAWARAIRLEGARVEGLKIDEEAFKKWMRQRHLALIDSMIEQELSGEQMVEAWNDYVQQRGFADPKAYDVACREEFLGEAFVALEYPVETIDDAALRRRFREIHTAYSVTALVFAPETMSEPTRLDQNSEKDRALFRSWWQTLSDFDKRIVDDKERPAAEVECLYFRFDDKSMAQLKEEFERKRPDIGNSLAEATAHYELTELDRFKMGMRWIEYRRTTMAHINGELPEGLDDSESFELVKDYLEIEWRIIRYLGDIWKELRALPIPADVHGAGLKYGIAYRHLDFQPNYRLQEDADGGGALAGDHPLGFRRTKPGEIFDYNTRPESTSKVYYVEGVVDQPGLHASIYRLMRFEGQRALEADAAMPFAWDRFEEANAYRVALQYATAFAAMLEKNMAEAIAAAKPADAAERAAIERDHAREEFAAYFDERKALAKQARVIGPFVVRPFEEIPSLAKTRGMIEQRVIDFVERDWRRMVGPVGTQVESGQIIPMARSDERNLALLLRIDAVHTPSDTQFDRDPEGRRRARASLDTEGRSTRATAAQTVYRYPSIMHHFKLQAPELDRLMSERMKKSIGQKKPEAESK